MPKIKTKKENKTMSRDTYNYKRKAISIARQLGYKIDTIEKLLKATTDSEIARIMRTAREAL